MDRFDSPPEQLDHLSYVVDYLGIPLLIAPPLPADDSADIGVERPLPLYPNMILRLVRSFTMSLDTC